MRVTEFTAWHVRIPLKKPIQHASHTRTETDNIVVASRLPTAPSASAKGCRANTSPARRSNRRLRALQAKRLSGPARRLPGLQPAVTLAEPLRLGRSPGDDRGCRGNAARCALELALLDAMGKHFKDPSHVSSNSLAPRSVRAARPCPLQRGHHFGGWARRRFAAWKMWFYRLSQVKVKVGIIGQDDVDRLGDSAAHGSGSRSAHGRQRSLAADRCRPRIRRIAAVQHQVSSNLSPTPRRSVGGRARATRRAHHARRIAVQHDRRGACLGRAYLRSVQHPPVQMRRLHPQPSFGPVRPPAQLGYQLGCQVGESAILSAAGRHLASGVTGHPLSGRLYDHHLVKEALGTTDMTFGWGGWAQASGPGLGVEIDPAALERRDSAHGGAAWLSPTATR